MSLVCARPPSPAKLGDARMSGAPKVALLGAGPHGPGAWPRRRRQPAPRPRQRRRPAAPRSPTRWRPSSAARVGTVEGVLADPAIAAVLIATSTSTHLDLVLAALAAGKAVFCEKPLDLDLARLRAHAAELERPAQPLYVAFNRRFDPHLQRAEGAARRRRDRRAGDAASHQPRPRAAAARLHPDQRRPLPRLHHPRLRHGALAAGRGAGRAVRLGLVPGRSGHRRGRRRRHRAAHPPLRLRQALRDQQHPPQRLRLRPARRGLRFEGRGLRRQPAPRPPPRPGREAGALAAPIYPRLPDSLRQPPTPPSSTISPRCWPARPSR